MSSPPTPNTSVRAAPLCTSRHKKRENPSSFPSIATFNLFRKKPPQPSSPVEPYEIAPVIWSIDATARVFGYLDTNDKRAKSRVQNAGPDIQAPRQKAKRKPVPVRGLLGECKQAHFAEGTEQYKTDTIRDEVKASSQFRQERKDEQRIKRGSNRPGARRGSMRTVSRDDQLVERGANPRTGLVSPFVVSDSSEECLGGDYIAVGKVRPASPSPRRKTRSEKWKQDSLGWSLVESPLLSPIAQSMSDKTGRTVSIKQLGDRLLVEMPGVDNHDPQNMTDGQIKKYQEGIARAYRRGGGSIAMLDPDTLPSPRQWTPEGPSTPPTKLHKIQRKEVGSGVVRKSGSGDTVIINANSRESSLPTPRKDIMKRQRVRIITPSNTPKGSSFESHTDISNAMRKTDPFLGRESQTTCSQTASATQSQSSLITGQAHQCLPNESEPSPSPTLSDPPPASLTLNQYLPRLQFLHPSHFANLGTSSYRRPTQRLPARLKPLEQQRQAVKDVCTTTFITTSTKGPRWGQRPKMQRQEESSVVPRVNYLSPGCEMPLDGYRQASAPRNKQSYPSTNSVDSFQTSGLMTARSRAIRPTEKAVSARDQAETKYQRKEPMPADCLRQPPGENWPKNLANPTQLTQGLSIGRANVARERIQRDQSGDGCTPIYGHLGNESRAVPGVKLQYVADDKAQATLPAELAIGGDSRAWFAGQWAEAEPEGEHPNLTALMQEDTLAHRRSILRKAADMKWWFYAAEACVELSSKLGFVQQLLHQMICHVMRTLHHASPALTTLRTANATTQDHFRAMKDLALAAAYLLVLLNLFMVVTRMLVFVNKVLYCVWHPVQTILVIIGWCIVG
ncbi:hypothetical protein HO173_007104 [Letharia columbiana]|uniref:Uncharacterized protein n=1 Tax=Letharia columbiana TaxID=112416 RepID=A0A8H6L3U7_9LECA|nr:uncharacterized protein HO173_007104 [Letharia columbiana]KAF6234479.1 hypothetical protein HO173_007104 [Letharia columbiana]